MKTIGFILQSPPHGSARLREGLDAILAASALCEKVRVFFLGDGLYGLLPQQNPIDIGMRDIAKTFGLFELYDINDIIFCQDALRERGLNADTLILSGQALDSAALRAQLGSCDVILNF